MGNLHHTALIENTDHLIVASSVRVKAYCPVIPTQSSAALFI